MLKVCARIFTKNPLRSTLPRRNLSTKRMYNEYSKSYVITCVDDNTGAIIVPTNPYEAMISEVLLSSKNQRFPLRYVGGSYNYKLPSKGIVKHIDFSTPDKSNETITELGGNMESVLNKIGCINGIIASYSGYTCDGVKYMY